MTWQTGLLLFALTVLAPASAGCRSTNPLRSSEALRPVAVLPAKHAPLIPLRLVSTTSAQARSLITIEDRRPDSERQYYPGSTDPRQWRDAITMVPMDAFEPSIEDQLRERLKELDFADKGNASGLYIEITSFQFVYDKREDVEGEFVALRNNWKQGYEKSDEEREESAVFLPLPASDASLGEELMSQAGRAVFVDLPRAVRRTRKARREYTAENQTTPESITLAKQTGLNCQLHGVVTITNDSGVQNQFPVNVLLHSPPSDVEPVRDQAASIVEAAINEFCEQIEREYFVH